MSFICQTVPTLLCIHFSGNRNSLSPFSASVPQEVEEEIVIEDWTPDFEEQVLQSDVEKTHPTGPGPDKTWESLPSHIIDHCYEMIGK